MSDIFDFGFTAVTEDELEVVTTEREAGTETQERLERLFNAITPLLNNLKKNPEKDYILWPNRLSKVEQFEDMSGISYLKLTPNTDNRLEPQSVKTELPSVLTTTSIQQSASVMLYTDRATLIRYQTEYKVYLSI